jgi:hypothetical protein
MGKIRAFGASAALVAALSIAGCAAPAAEPSPSPTQQVDAAAIDDSQSAYDWTQSVTASTSKSEMTAGVDKLTDLLPTLGIWFEAHNEIGQKLVAIQSDLSSGDTTAEENAASIHAVGELIATAVRKGNRP